MLVRVFEDVAEARRTILRRTPVQDVESTPEMLAASERIWGEPLEPDAVVDRILARVRAEGDAALHDITRLIERVELDRFEVDRATIERAFDEVPARVVDALRLAAERVRRFHERHMPRSWLDYEGDGATGQLVTPIERVGLHVPGGRAAYPSTVIMSAVPARVAGCREVVMCTPPRRDGRPAPVSLVAAAVAGVDRVFALGGAQSIAAMAFGTETVPRVDKIFGPGNVFVVLAKRKVFGEVGIDQIPGPTETVVVADESADPAAAAADLLAQAEHDPLASAILLATTRRVADAVALEVERQLATLERREIAGASIARNGGIVVAGSVEAAIELANEYAPEHLCLLVRDAWSYLGQVRNAGGVFVGTSSPEAVGDYTVGPSHVMPTGGTARFSSGMTVFDFVKMTSVFAVGPRMLEELGPAAAELAVAEGLGGHAAAIHHRLASGVKRD